MTVNRFDIATPDWLSSPASIQEDGSIKAQSIITSIGVFPYKRADGTFRHELRTPDVVFDASFIESIKNIPITLNHVAMITDSNDGELRAGSVGGDIKNDNVYLSAPVHITREDAVNAVLSGTHRSFSVGYTCDVEDEEGVWCGIKYDAVQKNLKANHLALVPTGRQGDQAVLRMDSADANMVTDASVVEAKDKFQEVPMADLKKIVLDGIEYSAEETVVKALNTSKERLDAMQTEMGSVKTEKTKIEAERDSFKERCDALDAKVKGLEASKLDAAEIEKAVQRRVKVLDSARLAEVEVKTDMAEADIQKAVILKVFPTAKLDGKDSTYIDARFDGALEVLENKGDEQVRTAGAAHTDAGDNVPDSKKARQAYIDRLTKKKKE